VAAEVLFVGTAHGMEQEVIPRLGFALQLIPAEQLRGRSVWGGLRAVWAAIRSIGCAWRIVREFAPDLIFSIGGYASGPTVVAGWLRQIPCVLLEPNAIPGLTNRLLGRLATRVCVGFPRTVASFPDGKAVYTGNPVRWNAADLPAATSVEGETARFSVLIIGGSAGARRLNQTLPYAFASLKQQADSDCSFCRLRIIHQTGKAAHAEVTQMYAQLGVKAEVVAFIESMDTAYAAADLVICRAGATTVAELTALGKPAIFVPYPYAADDHQRANAEVLVQAGAALMILDTELSMERVSQAIQSLMQDPARLEVMAQAAAALGKADATTAVIRECLACLPTPLQTATGEDRQ
jgi:UDP-N-acetylglucosamine--N-acetylmuramyl-(pentapeptide) pyrophosphoryl-undecaprenol N-acetylglucosamine transferase